MSRHERYAMRWHSCARWWREELPCPHERRKFGDEDEEGDDETRRTIGEPASVRAPLRVKALKTAMVQQAVVPQTIKLTKAIGNLTPDRRGDVPGREITLPRGIERSSLEAAMGTFSPEVETIGNPAGERRTSTAWPSGRSLERQRIGRSDGGARVGEAIEQQLAKGFGQAVKQASGSSTRSIARSVGGTSGEEEGGFVDARASQAEESASMFSGAPWFEAAAMAAMATAWAHWRNRTKAPVVRPVGLTRPAIRSGGYGGLFYRDERFTVGATRKRIDELSEGWLYRDYTGTPIYR